MASDNFTRANESPLASPWVSDSLQGGMILASNVARSTGGGDRSSSYTASTRNRSRVTIGSAGDTNGGPAIHCQGGGYYYFLSAYSGTTIAAYLVFGGGYTLLDDVPGVYSVSDVVEIYRDGVDIVATLNTVEILRVADTTLIGGLDGMAAYDGGLTFSAWSNGSTDNGLTDDFNRSDQTPVASPWADNAGTGTVGCNLISNRLASSGIARSSSYYIGSANAYSQVTLANVPGTPASGADSNDVGPAIHCDGAGNFYYASVYWTGTQWNKFIGLRNGGSFTTISDTAAGITPTSGTQLRLRRVSSDLVFDYYNGSSWTNLITASDTTLTAGSDGVFIGFNKSTGLDDWSNFDTLGGGGGASPTLTDVDADETVTAGQTGATITGTNLGAATTDRGLTIEQGSVAVTQTQTSGNATSGAFTVVMEPGGAALKFGTATAKVTIVSGGATATLGVTVNPASGHAYIDVGTPNTNAANRISASGDLVSGDQLHVRGVGGGSIPTGLTLASDATFSFTAGNAPTAFDVRAWDQSDQTWGSWATQSIEYQPSAVALREAPGQPKKSARKRIARGLTWLLDLREWWG